MNIVPNLFMKTILNTALISRLGEKAIPLYQMLKKTDDFVWSEAANEAFEDLKR